MCKKSNKIHIYIFGNLLNQTQVSGGEYMNFLTFDTSLIKLIHPSVLPQFQDGLEMIVEIRAEKIRHFWALVYFVHYIRVAPRKLEICLAQSNPKGHRGEILMSVVDRWPTLQILKSTSLKTTPESGIKTSFNKIFWSARHLKIWPLF